MSEENTAFGEGRSCTSCGQQMELIDSDNSERLTVQLWDCDTCECIYIVESIEMRPEDFAPFAEGLIKQ